MIKSELINNIAKQQPYLSHANVEAGINAIIDRMIEELGNGGQIQVRRFGIFSVRKRKAIIGRNPKTGEAVLIKARHVVHFKATKDLKARVDESSCKYIIRG